MDAASNTRANGDGIGDARTVHAVPTLLVVDPDPLLRWSLAAYFSRWFDVIPTDSGAVACCLLGDRSVDAVVLPDDLVGVSADELTTHALARNANVRVIRTGTGSASVRAQDGETPHIEKPFRLADLAELLGVSALTPLDVSVEVKTETR